jgi:TPR repeat protein
MGEFMKQAIIVLLMTTCLSFALFGAFESADQIVNAIGDLMDKAHAGDAMAQYQLGQLYYAGKDIPQNYDEAVKWFRTSSDKGLTLAQAALGKCYLNGDGVEKNVKEAKRLFNIAAQDNSPEAQFLLGIMHYAGDGVPVNFDEGFKWFKLSAEQGYAEAQENLGFCYYEGSGVKIDVPESCYWLSLALANCTPDKTEEYSKALEIKKAELTDEQIRKIDTRVKDWIKAHKK